jgi:putative hemolysin
MKKIIYAGSMIGIVVLMLLEGCDRQVIGGEKDSHGCMIAAGYSWCEAKQKCIRSWEENCTKTEQLVGNDKDEHGCIGSAGYSWCEAKQKCIRSWEENCTTEGSQISQMANPASVNCVDKGGKLTIETSADGSQTGICTLQDGTKCEEWAYFRGECP